MALTDALRQRLVPLACGLTHENGRSKQVVARVTVVEHYRAKGEIAVLDLALPDGVGRDAWVRTVDH